MAIQYESGGGKSQPQKSTYPVGSWDWIQEQQRKAFQEKIKKEQEAAIKSSSPQNAQPAQSEDIPIWINPDEYDPRTGSLDSSKNNKPVTGGTRQYKWVSPWMNPDEVDPYTGGLQESGSRNLVDPSAEIVGQINEAIRNDDRKALQTSLWRYSNLGPSYAAAMDYNDRFQLRLVNGETHVIDRDNKAEEGFDNAADAIKYIYNNKTGMYTYTNRYGNTVTKEWTISNDEFLDKDALTQQQITDIMNSKNPGLVERGFDIAVYEYAQRKGINPKVILATLAQEQSWCKKGKYKSAFGVGPGGNPIDFAEGELGGLADSVNIFLRWFSYAQELEAEGALEPMHINYDRSPYPETRAKYENVQEWQKNNPRDFEFMEKGQYVIPVNAAMYAKLKYTPWVDFPPQSSHPLDLWHDIFRSF